MNNLISQFKGTTAYITLALLVSYATLCILNEGAKENVANHFSNNTLLIIAHPDDESMFFGPTILNLIKVNKSVSILCLSNGNMDNLGRERQQEFNSVVKAYGPLVKLKLLNESALQDNIQIDWPINTVANLIKDFVDNHDGSAKTLITFDSYGVSGHPNHQSIYQAIIELKEQLVGTKILILESVPLLRKYIFFMDSVIALLVQLSNWKPTTITLSINLVEHANLKNILALHHSQMVWFRKLYMMFSRYMFINDLKCIT